MSKNKQLFIFGIIALAIVLIVSFTGMFWDNVTQIYMLSNWLYTHGLFHFEMPNTFDPGVPPTVPFLHALAWKKFGQSLLISHLLMWPFVFGLIWQLFRLIDFYVEDKKYLYWVFALVMADPSFCSMITLINYEVVQYFLFFGAINSVVRGQYRLKTLFLAFLGLISLRSMMLCGSVFLFDVVIFTIIDKKQLNQISIKHHIFPYVIGSLPALTFLVWHYSVKGWVFGNADSPWAECGTLVNGYGFVRNILVLAHRLVDFGRIFIWGALFLFLLLFRNNKTFFNQTTKQLVLLWGTTIFLIGGVSLMLNNPMGHRYFVANYLILALFTGITIIRFALRKQRCFVLMIILLLSGNLWLYPTRISQGWDSTLGHLPYWHLRTEMIRLIDERNIKIEETATFFPNYCSIKAIELNGDDRVFPKFDGTQQYVFMSNVFNLSDEDYDMLESNYHVIEQLSFYPVRVMLYQRNNFNRY